MTDDIINTTDWRIEFVFDESFCVYKKLKKIVLNSKTEILHKRLIFFNEKFIKEISSHKYLLNNLDLYEERYISDTGLIFDEEIMNSVNEMSAEDDDQKSKKIDFLFKIFKILFIGGRNEFKYYALSFIRLTINNLIKELEDGKILDLKLSEFSKLLVCDEVIEKDIEFKAFDYSLHFASSISNRYIRCYCGKYTEKRYKDILCEKCNIVVSEYGLINGTFKNIFSQLSRFDKFSKLNKVSLAKIIDIINKNKNAETISLLVFGLESFLAKEYIITDLINSAISKTEDISVEEKIKPYNLDKKFSLVKEFFIRIVSNENKISFRELSSMINRLIVNYYKNNKQKQINLCIDDFFKLIEFSDQRTIKSFALNMLEQDKVDLSIKSLKFLEYRFLKDYCDFITENNSLEECLIFLNKMKRNKSENAFSLDSKLFNSNKNDDFSYLCNFKDNIHHLSYYVVYEFFKQSQENSVDDEKLDLLRQLFLDDKLMIT